MWLIDSRAEIRGAALQIKENIVVFISSLKGEDAV